MSFIFFCLFYTFFPLFPAPSSSILRGLGRCVCCVPRGVNRVQDDWQTFGSIHVTPFNFTGNCTEYCDELLSSANTNSIIPEINSRLFSSLSSSSSSDSGSDISEWDESMDEHYYFHNQQNLAFNAKRYECL